jgi:hypothetical protein
MNTRIAIAGLLFIAALGLGCQTKEKEDIGAAGKPEEMADSTRLDSSASARNKAGGVPDRSPDATN